MEKYIEKATIRYITRDNELNRNKGKHEIIDYCFENKTPILIQDNWVFFYDGSDNQIIIPISSVIEIQFDEDIKPPASSPSKPEPEPTP